MANKKKNPSFEIPDAVRRAGQSGWVYRSDPAKGKRHSEAAAHHAPKPVVAPPIARPAPAAAAPKPAAPPEPEVVVAPTSPPASDNAWNVSTGVVGLGLQVAAVPLVVPLYVTAAISRKLGLLPR